MDQDISEILQDVGCETTKKVLEKARDEIVEKKVRRIDDTQEPFDRIQRKIRKDRTPFAVFWLKNYKCKVLADEMGMEHEGRSHAVNRAPSDFGIEESFGQAGIPFKEHYNFDIGSSATARETKSSASLAEIYMKERLEEAVFADVDQAAKFVESMLVEIDGCEIRTALFEEIEDARARTAVYGNPKKRKIVNWRDVRIGFARPLDHSEKTFVGGMDPYPVVVGQLRKAALARGMGPETDVVAVADGCVGIKEELERQFPGIQFILDKPHVKDHLERFGDAVDLRFVQGKRISDRLGRDRERAQIHSPKAFENCRSFVASGFDKSNAGFENTESGRLWNEDGGALSRLIAPTVVIYTRYCFYRFIVSIRKRLRLSRLIDRKTTGGALQHLHHHPVPNRIDLGSVCGGAPTFRKVVLG